MRRLAIFVTEQAEVEPLLRFLDSWPQHPLEADFWVLRAAPRSRESIPVVDGQGRLSNSHAGELPHTDSASFWNLDLPNGPAVHFLGPDNLNKAIETASRFSDLVLVATSAYSDKPDAKQVLDQLLTHAPVLLVGDNTKPENVAAPANIEILKVLMRFRVLREKPLLLFSSTGDSGEDTKSVMGYATTYTERTSFLHLDGHCLPALERILPENCIVALPANWQLPCGHEATPLLRLANERQLAFFLTPNLPKR